MRREEPAYITLRDRPELEREAAAWFHNKWGVTPICLVTGHTGFYERCGREFLCPLQSDGEDQPARMYIHR